MADAPLHVPTFVVIGGGPAGDVYVRQLLRAVRAGRLATERVLVVDRDPGCAVSRRCGPRAGARPEVVLERASWADWLDAHLDELGSDDHLVPYHWAPHLLRDWLARQVAAAGAVSSPAGDVPPRGLPFEGTTAAGDRALSYASWICPPLCIEPALCPHTRGPKDWSLARDLESSRPDDPWDGRAVFRCLHLVYGVGTIPVAEIVAARDRLVAALEDGPRTWLVATSSHCHALASTLRVVPGARCRGGSEA